MCIRKNVQVALDDEERVVYYNEIFSISSLDVAGLHKAADKPVGVLPQVQYYPSNITQARKKRTNFVTWTTTADTMTGDEEFLPSEFVPTPLHSLLSDYTNQHVNKMEFNRAYLMRKTPGMCLCIMGCFLFLDPPAILVMYCAVQYVN